MKKIQEKFKAFWASLDSLESQIYYLVLAVGIVASVVSGLAAVPQHLGALALIGTFSSTVALVLLWIVSRRTRRENVCRVILVYLMNLVIFPVNYFICGGLTSGMVLFYLVGLFNVAIMLRGTRRIVAFFVSLLAMEFSITLGRSVPGLVTPLTELQQYQDVKITLFLTGATVMGMTILILRAFERERKRGRELMEVQRTLSIRDPLTGLYNRRELFRRLEALFAPEAAEKRSALYLAMFDVDNFKSLNDTYGHLFGDQVLSTVGEILQKGRREDESELAARYGGEEFVVLLRAENAPAAFQRADSLRRKLSQHRWEEVPAVQVTLSGGVVPCSDHELPNKAISQADDLLYRAKHSGKNRICQMLHDAPETQP